MASHQPVVRPNVAPHSSETVSSSQDASSPISWCTASVMSGVNGEIPLPDRSVFGEEDLTDLDDALREQFRAMSIPEPVRVATDHQALRDPRRYDVPITVITCEVPAEMLRGLMAKGHACTAELATVHDSTLVDLPTGHWPQLTKPAELGAAIVETLA